MRRAAAITMSAAAVASLGLLLRATQHTPPLLRVLFVIWVLAPFLAAGWASMASKRWPRLVLVLALASLAAYGYDALRPPRAQAAFVYVMVPPISVIIAAAVMAAGRLRRGSRLD
jgi:hypothetical protein